MDMNQYLAKCVLYTPVLFTLEVSMALVQSGITLGVLRCLIVPTLLGGALLTLLHN